MTGIESALLRKINNIADKAISKYLYLLTPLSLKYLNFKFSSLNLELSK